MAPKDGGGAGPPDHPPPRRPPPDPTTSPLLALPQNVLHLIAHLIGPPARLICRTLHTAHGPLRTARPIALHTPAALQDALTILSTHHGPLLSLYLTHAGALLTPALAPTLPALLPNLCHLTLRHCAHLTPPLLTAITTSLPHLTSLDLQQCTPLLTPAGLAAIIHSPAARHLHSLALDLHPSVPNDAPLLYQLATLTNLRALSLNRVASPYTHFRDTRTHAELIECLGTPPIPPTLEPGTAQPHAPAAPGVVPANLPPVHLVHLPPADPPPDPLIPNIQHLLLDVMDFGQLPPQPEPNAAPLPNPAPAPMAPNHHFPPPPAGLLNNPVPGHPPPPEGPFGISPFNPVAAWPSAESSAALLEATSSLPHLQTLKLPGFLLQDPPAGHPPSCLAYHRTLTSLTLTLGPPPDPPGAPPPVPAAPTSTSTLLASVGTMAGHLRHLDLTLRRTVCNTSLRACLGQLEDLASLSLTFSRCDPPLIMDVISKNMTALTRLRLAACPHRTTGFDDTPQTEWLRDLAPTLRVLELDQVAHFRRVTLQALTSLRRLTELRISNLCALRGVYHDSLPQEFAYLDSFKQLQVLHLEGKTPCSWALPQLPQLTALTCLKLLRCDAFGDDDLQELCQRLTALRSLDLTGSCSALERGLLHLRRLPRLCDLTLSLVDYTGLAASPLRQHLIPPPPVLQRLYVVLPRTLRIGALQLGSSVLLQCMRVCASRLAEHGCALVLQLDVV